MTRPVFEPNINRTDRALGFSADQLFRRPVPAGFNNTQWIKATSTTDLGTSFTELDFVEDGDSCYTSPTFAINGAGNLEIGVDGMYDLMIWIHDESSTSANQVEVTWLRGYRNAGATPVVIGPSSFVTPREVRILQRYDDTTVLDTGNLAIMPDWYTPLAYFTGDIAIDGTTEVEFEAYVEINGTGTATSDIGFSLFCRLIGGPCTPSG